VGSEHGRVGDWAEELGQKHGAREQAAVLATRTTREGAAESVRVSLERWTRIVAAVRHLVGAYNAGVEREVIRVVEDRSVPSRPSVTIHLGGEDDPSLLAALEGAVICVRSRDAGRGARDGTRALRPDRGDEQTAALWPGPTGTATSRPVGVA
jgi:hypothetical protein